MTDIVVSRIQNRRGLRINLPQPLLPGELGFCTDTKQLFIGGDPATPPVGVQVYLDISNSISIVQSYTNNNIIPVDVYGAFGGADLTSLRAAIGGDADLVQWDDALKVHVGFTGASAPVLTAINVWAGSNPGKIDFTNTFTTVSYTTPDVGMGVTVDESGFFSMPSYAQSYDVALVLNAIHGSTGIATSSLNVEITDLLSAEPESDQLFINDFSAVLVPSGTFVDFPGAGVSWSIAQSDSFIIEYSASMDDNPNYYTEVGTLTVVSSSDQSDATCASATTEMANFATTAQLDIQAVFVGPGTVKLQYRHNFSENITFVFHTRRWASFVV